MLGALVLLAASSAAAEPIPDQPAQLQLAAGWRAEPAPAAPDGPVLVVRGPDGALGAVTVAMTPNPEAWRDRTRRAYVDAIIAGFAAQHGVTVRKRTVSKVAGVPCVDLRLVRDRHRVAVRLLLFRTRTIALVIDGADDAKALVPNAPAR